MRVRVLNLLLSLLLVAGSYAQTQQGIVKTKGRLDDKGNVIPGIPLQDAIVTVKGRNRMASNQQGKFSFPTPGQNYYLVNAEKQGYLLTDPDILSRQHTYSKEALYVVMETPDMQTADKLAAEQKIRRTLQKTLFQLEDEIEQLKEENKISLQEYQKKLQDLYSTQEKNEKLISDMAERYSRIDYDQVDEFNRRISELILNGELTKADSLLNTKGDIHARAAALRQQQDANAKEEKELARRQDNLSKSKAGTQKELEDLAQDCYHKYEIFKMNFQNDSAAYYIELRAELDTMNVEWQLVAGTFICDYRANYNSALSYYQKALHSAKQHFGEKHPNVATSYNYIGNTYNYKNDHTQALEYYNKALEIRRDIFGENHPDVAQSYNNIGFIYNSLADYGEALTYFNKALNIYRNTLEEQHPDIAMSYNNIGSVYNSQADYSKALTYYNKALNIYRNTRGENHADVARSYNNIGFVYSSLADYDNALTYYNKALEIRRDVLGENHPDIATSYNNIGTIYYSQGEYNRTLEYFNKAIEIFRNILDENHPDIATSYNNIGTIYYSQGEYNRTLEYFNKAIEIFRNILGENHPDVAASYYNIGFVYNSQKDYAQALLYHNKAIEIRLSMWGENHPDVAQSYNEIGAICSSQGDYTNALEYHNKALEIFQNFFEDSHPNVLKTKEMIETINKEMKK